MVPFTERVEWTETVKPSARRTIAIIVTAAMLTFIGWCEAQAQTATVSPSSLAFTGTEGTSNPTAQAVTLWKKGNRTRTWTVSRPVPWITVTPSSGTISRERDNISVAVNLAGLKAGNYTTSVIITLGGHSEKHSDLTHSRDFNLELGRHNRNSHSSLDSQHGIRSCRLQGLPNNGSWSVWHAGRHT